jgi:hypothetical protein
LDLSGNLLKLEKEIGMYGRAGVSAWQDPGSFKRNQEACERK